VVAFLVAADAPKQQVSIATIETAASSIGGIGVLIIFAVSAAVAVSLQPMQFRLVQLLEGYWPAWFPPFLLRFGIWLEQRRRDRIRRRLVIVSRRIAPTAEAAARERAQAAETQLRQRFPAQERLLPTALGNALRASEDTVGQRYGLESVVIWPRLFPLLPDRVRDGVDDEVTQLDVSVRLAVTWTLAGAISTSWLLRDLSSLGHNHPWLLVPAGVFVLARLSYQSAVESAIAQGVDLEVAIDLYRARVIDAMRLHSTVSLEHERRVFGELCELFQTPSVSTQNLHFKTTARAGGST